MNPKSFRTYSNKRQKMSALCHQYLSAALVLGAVQLIAGYSFNNCIADSHATGTQFSCFRRRERNISAFVDDLPSSVTNLTIAFNPVCLIPNHAFAHLPNLKFLRIDHNHLTNVQPSAFQNLHQLQFLNLSCNNVSKLSRDVFKDLHNLTFLSLTNNKLKQLPVGIFSTTLTLNTLIMRQNLLMDFSGIVESVSHLPNLKTLDLCYNHLTSLGHNASLPASLSVLYLCRNNLFTLGCKPSFLGFIKVLDLSYNARLPTAAFHGVDLKHVIYLRLRSTNVDVVELFNISNIRTNAVDFSGTGLKTYSQLTELCSLLKRKANPVQKLSLSSNGIENMPNDTFSLCPTITGTLDLSLNELKSTSCLLFLGPQMQIKSFNAEHNHLNALPSCCAQKTIPFLEELSYRYNHILSVKSMAFVNTPNIKVLQLNINKIAFFHHLALRGLRMLQTLRLDNNLLTELLKDTFHDNSNLQYLNLRNNRIAVIFNGTFLRLRNLTTLDLGGNKITHFQPSGLKGLTSLAKFYLDGNNLLQIDASFHHVFHDALTVLDLKGNQICFLNEKVNSPFSNLRNLRDLKLDAQRPYGLGNLPSAFFRGLYSLKNLYLTNNYLSQFAPDAFDDLTNLNFLSLDSCCKGVAKLEAGVFRKLRNLTKLSAENVGIEDFSAEVFGNLTHLSMLELNYNVMRSMDVNVLLSLKKLRYLDIRNVPLSCTCENSLLQNWTRQNPNVQVVYLYNQPCPHDAEVKFYNFDTKVCFIDLGEYLFFSTAVVIFLFTLTPILYVKLYWKLKYSYYVFRSWFSEQWRRMREEEENCTFDAFISYNSCDEKWVMDHLVPNLEGDGSGFKLCLHHRDFELGRFIVDNIVSAVYNSRKTVCVVSRSFLQSEWCSLEIQLASYRLFDEHRDVLLLVFLEPISERQLSSFHRMRKVMLKKTYLQWPSSDCINPVQAQELFWDQLRRAMRAGSRIQTEREHDCDSA
ncbi:toll-like receptor 21 [Solea solea]|uniref:toll-like receptor 21 n=1 Tax=Solea solea TaxID=90069 RepID=UPI00272A794C|nr:toll-like receptor 21 [Solea solea]